MKTHHKLYISLMILVLVVSSSIAQESVDHEVIAKIREEGFQHSQVMDIVGHITDVFGNRLTGSRGMKKAQKWAKVKMEAIGLVNSVIEPSMDHGVSWDNEYNSIHMLEPDYQPINGFPLAFTPGTGGKIVKQAIIADVQIREDLEKFKGKLKGAVVLISPLLSIDPAAPIVATRRTEEDLKALSEQFVRPPSPRRNRVENPNMMSEEERIAFFKSEGAAVLLQCRSGRLGAVRTFARPGSTQDKWSAEGIKNSLPILSVVPEHYNRIYRILKRNIPVTIEVDIRNRIGEKTKAYNVLGEIPGTDLKDELVMLGAHFDSWHSSPGASDNAAGCAVALEAVRILKTIGVQPRRTIRVALWSSEEDGINGSREYVKKYFGDTESGIKPAYDHFSVYFNMDNGKGQFRGMNMQRNEHVRSIFKAWMEPFHDLGMTTLRIRYTGSTDHIPFDRVGLPGFQFIQDRVGQGTGHTNMDFYDNLIPEDLMKNAVIMASFVYHAAMRDDKMPRKTMNDNE